MSGELSHSVSASVRKILTGCGINTTSRILVGVSGGVDSMVLLYILHTSGYKVTAAHVNFNLRGVESANDALFVAKWCAEQGIPYDELSKDTKTYATAHKLNTQAAARIIRYEWWGYLVHKHEFDFVATAHHLDDSIETVFLNLLRGTGLKGLRGIPQSRGYYIRPLLECSKSAIEAFAKTYAIPFRMDESNLSDQYQRNKLRHHLIPLLEELSPGFQASLKHTLHRVNIEWDAWDHAYNDWITANIKPFQDGFRIEGTSHKMAFLLRWLEDKGIPWMLAADFLTAPKPDSGRILHYLNFALSRTEEGYYLEESQPATHFTIHGPGTHSMGHFMLSIEYVPADDFAPDANPWIEYVNEDVIRWPLHIRTMRPGDSFQPLGMGGKTKKLQDLLVDHKLEMFEKERQLLLTNDEHILWVVGLRLDERARVKHDEKRIYRLTYSLAQKD